MPQRILLDKSLLWGEVDGIAQGAQLALSDGALARIRAARSLVECIVSQGLRAYGVNTGVGALCDVVVTESKQVEKYRHEPCRGSRASARDAGGAGHHRLSHQ
jgi:histidine ammonia-lyase